MQEKVIGKIPKIIHYMWMGDKAIPERDLKCMETWRKFCPDYEIMLWTDKNFDMDLCPYLRESYDNKMYAFVADYVRCYVLKKYGGIYLDTDVEIYKNIDFLLENKSFIGFQNRYWLGSAIMGCERGGAIWIDELLKILENRHFQVGKKLDIMPAPVLFTDILKKYGVVQKNRLQKLDFVTVYPSDYFFAQDFYTGKLKKTANTVMVHKFAATWLKGKDWFWIKLGRGFSKVIGTNAYVRIIEWCSLLDGKLQINRMKKYNKKAKINKNK